MADKYKKELEVVMQLAGTKIIDEVKRASLRPNYH